MSVRPPWTRRQAPAGHHPEEPVEDAPRPRARYTTAAGWVAVALAALYPLVEAVRLIAESRPTPLYGDNALLDLAARRAADFDQLVGPYSREGFHHPGPVSSYVMAPFVSLLGSGQGGYLAAVVVTGACVVAITVLMWRWCSASAALFTAATLGLFELCVRVFTLREPWNPYMVVAPMLLLAVLAAGAMAGRRGAWAWSLVVGSYALQTHISTGPAVVALVVAGAVPSAVRAARGGERGVSRPALAGLAVTVLAWVPSVIELAVDKPNNLTLLWDFYRQAHPEPIWHDALRAAANAIAIVPFGNATYVTSILRPRWELAVTLVGLGVLVVVSLALAGWRRLGLPAGLVASAVLVCVAGAYGLKHASGGITAYFATWMAAAPVLGLLALGAAVLTPRPQPAPSGEPLALPARPSLCGRLWVAACLAVVAAVAAAATVRSDLHMTPATKAVVAPQAVAGQMAQQVMARHPQGVVSLDIESEAAWPEAAGVALSLYRHHIPAVVTPAQWTLYFGDQERPGRPVAQHYSFYTQEAAQAAHLPPGAALVAGFDVVMAAGPPPPTVKPDPLP